MNHQNLVSIIIPCYNQAQYLKEAVLSAVNQTYTNIEIIIVNDGSTDNSEEIALHLQKQYPEKIRIISQKNSGVSGARNTAIEEAKGEYILPFDADDILYEKMVESTLYAMQKYEVDIVSPNVQLFGTKSYLMKPVSFSECTLLYSNCWIGTSLFKKKVWETNGGYKINMKEGYEDWELWVNAYKHGFIFYHLPITLLYYRTKEISRDIIAVTKDVYLKAKIILNHPELYTKSYIKNATSVLKQNEDSADLYFYQQNGLKNFSKSFFNNIVDIISKRTLKQSQIITVNDEKIGLCTIDYYENPKSVQSLTQELKVRHIIFFAPLKYKTDTLQICTFAWDKQKGIVTSKGTIFPFVPKGKRDNLSTRFIAYQRWIKFLKNKGKKTIAESMLNSLMKRITKKVIFYNKIKTLKQKFLYKYGYLFHRKTRGHNTYTIILSVYNVEKYIDDFFTSIKNQTLIFKKHINIIVVNDGSTDNSESIVKRWKTKFPNNIIYLDKPNGGLPSARNFGLDYIKKNNIKTDWIGFIDPDDFIHYKYFERIDTFLHTHKQYNISLISSNLILYFENNKLFKNIHPLKYKFKKAQTILPVDNLKNFIQLSAATALFRPEIIFEHNMSFNEKIKPNFEDGHFINLYLQYATQPKQQYQIVFLRDVKYFYRKRETGGSMIDTSWGKKEKYSDVLINGYIDLLMRAKENHHEIPLYIQYTVLYDLSWYFKYLINHEERVNFLSEDEKNTFQDLLFSIFQYIDINAIQSFNLTGISDMHKVSFIEKYKQRLPETYTVYITDYDQAKDEIQLSYYYYNTAIVEIMINDVKITPRLSKTRTYNFLDDVFVYEKILWLPLNGFEGKINISINERNTALSLKGRSFIYDMSLERLRKSLEHPPLSIQNIPFEHLKIRALATQELYKKRYNNAWILMDRDTQSDDNAEHLYRYIVNNHPEINAFFLLRKDSHDWQRLKDENFHLIAFGSLSHKIALLHADHLISSHADHYVTDYLPKKYYKDMLSYKFTFLQHGITKDDLSNWLNIKNIACFVTVSSREYQSIIEDNSPYKFTKKEVMLTGFPRHDTLIKGNDDLEKTILIMPTWRKNIVGKAIGKGNTREINTEFSQTTYTKHWKRILHSRYIRKLKEQHGFKIIFFPHANIQPYLEVFNIPEYIETISHQDISIQKLFQQAALMLTDYSSVAFEMGVLRKKVIYYQFDKEEVFGGGHLTKKGYFDYAKDGFGPVCYTEPEVWNAIDSFIDNGTTIEQKYLQRIENFFEFNDTNNCQRVFKAIQNLDAM